MATRYYNSRTYGLQKETRNYLRRLYTFNRELASSDIADIDNFIKGCKQLGIWQSMVCWPLRSQQNIGSGSTVLSLGGYSGGVFNGTMVNSPTWGTTGVTSLVSSAQGISVTFRNLSLEEQTLFGVGRNFVAGAGYVLIARNSTGGTQNGMNLRAQEFGAVYSSIQQVGGTTTVSVNDASSNVFLGYAVAANTTSGQNIRFPSVISTNTALSFSGPLTNTDPLWIGRRNAASGTADNTMAFASVFTKDIRLNWNNLYSLYKTTIGKGLGLP